MHYTKTASWRRVRRARFAGQLDLFARLQVLEGAAGVDDGDWTGDLRRGLDAAKDIFPDINDAWFKPSDLYSTLINKVQRVLTKGKVTAEDPEGVVSRMFGGLSRTGDKKTPALYVAGKKSKSGILSGSETPSTISKGVAGKWFERAALDLVRSRQRHLKKIEEDGSRFQTLNDRSQLEVLTELFLDPRSSLGEKIRDKMRDSWTSMDPARQRAANAWLDEIERTGTLPKQKALAKELGIHEQTMSKAVREGKELAQKAFLDDDKLLEELEEQYVIEGVGGNWSIHKEGSRSLRSQLLRLAHRVPKFRRHLVPMLRKASQASRR